MARYQLPGAAGTFNFFADTLCARAMRFIALRGELEQRDLMKHYKNVIGGGGQFTFAFERFCCHAAESVSKTVSCVCEHAFTGANPQCLACYPREVVCTNHPRCLACYPREVVCTNHGRHLIARIRTPTGRDSATRHNRVRYIGREPVAIVAALNDRALTAAYEQLERQVAPTDKEGRPLERKEEEQRDLKAWMDIVAAETAARAGRIGRVEVDADVDVVVFECPEHGDRAEYSVHDKEARCVDRDEVLDLDSLEVQRSIRRAQQPQQGAI